jgi:hypothetical protein
MLIKHAKQTTIKQHNNTVSMVANFLRQKQKRPELANSM